VNAIKGSFANAEHEGAALLERNVGGAGDERVRKTQRNRRQRAHGTRQDDHSIGGVAAAGDGSADVSVEKLHGFGRRGAEELLEQIGAAGDAELLGKDAERVFRGDKVDAGDSVVGFEGAKRLAGQDCAGCAGDGEG
jgi:hypothetical protein